MIKLFLHILLMAALTPFFGSKVTAVSPSSTVQATESGKTKLIENLKEKIATKVAEIRDKDKKAIFGTVKTADREFVITSAGKDYTVNSGDDTVLYSLKGKTRTEIKPDKISKGLSVTVFGYMTENSNTISAKYIYVQDNLVSLTGKIADKDTANFTLTVSTKQGSYSVDFEKTTRSFVFRIDKKTLTKSGFSGLKTGDFVQVTGTSGGGEKKISAIRILSLSGFSATETSPSGQTIKEASPKPEKTTTP